MTARWSVMRPCDTVAATGSRTRPTSPPTMAIAAGATAPPAARPAGRPAVTNRSGSDSRASEALQRTTTTTNSRTVSGNATKT